MGGKLLLDIGPKPDGTIPKEQVDRLKALGAWIEENKEATLESIEGIPLGHYYGPTTLSKDRKTLYLFVFDKPVEELLIKGLCTKVSKATVVGNEGDLNHKHLGGAPWLNVPGTTWIEFPENIEIGNGRVVKLELENEIEIYRGKSGAIEQN
jgi:alpha-L-fucosidase